MTIKNFITKGILPILLIGIITWLGQYIFFLLYTSLEDVEIHTELPLEERIADYIHQVRIHTATSQME